MRSTGTTFERVLMSRSIWSTSSLVAVVFSYLKWNTTSESVEMVLHASSDGGVATESILQTLTLTDNLARYPA